MTTNEDANSSYPDTENDPVLTPSDSSDVLPRSPKEPISFGTDGWRAIISQDFTHENVARACQAIALTFSELYPNTRTLLVGYDTRRDAGLFAQTAARTLSAYGFEVLLADSYVPTPALCWTIAHRSDIDGGIMLTASHNPAQYLGLKIRMADGGASPVEFTNAVEKSLSDDIPASDGSYATVDIMTSYLDDLLTSVDRDKISAAKLRVVVDPLYGSARSYLANTMRELGVDVTEIHSKEDPEFGGLHPEPIPPWTDEAAKTVTQGAYDAGFITDGDSDRLGAIDSRGAFITPHLIFVLTLRHLVDDMGRTGRVVRTLSGSELIARQAKRYHLDLATTPVGFKWIYEEMEKGDVLIGGEESGGIGIPSHVKERDALYIALQLLEMMAARKADLGKLVSDVYEDLGVLEYKRSDLRIDRSYFDAFVTRAKDVHSLCQKHVATLETRDGIKFSLADGSWLLLRASGTEPLVRIYAEAKDKSEVDLLIEEGKALLKS